MAKTTAFKHKKADDSAGFLLWKITALWQGKLSTVLEKFDINQTQFAILASLKWFQEHKEETSQAHIVEHAKIDKMTVSKAIRKLELKDFIIREKSDTDGRAINIKFTALGKNMVNKAIMAIESADDDFFSNLSEKQLETYKNLSINIIKHNAR